jgi:hypothetical protein
MSRVNLDQLPDRAQGQLHRTFGMSPELRFLGWLGVNHPHRGARSVDAHSGMDGPRTSRTETADDPVRAHTGVGAGTSRPLPPEPLRSLMVP